MRNIWYPNQKAEYMTESKLQQLNKKDLVIERDYLFGIEQPDQGDDNEGVGAASVVDVEMKLLPVLQSTSWNLKAMLLTIEASTSD